MTLIVEPTPVRVALGLWAGVVLCAAPLAAQDWEAFEGPRVEGLVLQSASGEPIESAAVRVVTEDGQQVLGSGYTDGDGRYRIFVFGAHDEHPGPVVVEAGRLGYRIAIGEPFEIDPDGVIQHPPLMLEPDAVLLDTVQVERRRHWSLRPPPRERVLQRQLEGRGTFLPGVVIEADPSYDLAEILVHRVDGLEFMAERGRRVINSVRGNRCIRILVNEWGQSSTALESIRTDRVGAVEVYLEFDDVPPDLQRHVHNQFCGVISIWLWDSWNIGWSPAGG